jgi:hypothetical protein
MPKRVDYISAKEYIITKTQNYARKILPKNISIHIQVSDITKDEDSRLRYTTIAYAAGNKDWTKSKLVYDCSMIKNNIYNIESSFFDALAVHELCHIKHGMVEPGINSRFYHSRPIYIDCLSKHVGREMAKASTHPDRYSFRAYLGSENKLVPQCITNMAFYVCKDCRNSVLWNSYHIGHHPYHCESCHSKNISWTRLSPFDVYRIAKINEIDYVESTERAIYNEA